MWRVGVFLRRSESGEEPLAAVAESKSFIRSTKEKFRCLRLNEKLNRVFVNLRPH